MTANLLNSQNKITLRRTKENVIELEEDAEEEPIRSEKRKTIPITFGNRDTF